MNASDRVNLFELTESKCLLLPGRCPYEICRYHLCEDRVFHGSQEIGEESCSLKAACDGARTLEEVGKFFGITRERVRQIELNGIKNVRRILQSKGIISDGDIKLGRRHS